MDASGAPELVVLLLIAIGLTLYFVPALIAGCRHHHQAMAIFVLNVFGGWTCLGWVVALVWASTAVHRPAVPASAPLFPQTPRFVRHPH